MWLCQCNCYGENSKRIVRGNDLRKGRSKSCGCLSKEISIKIGKASKKYNKYDLTGEFGIGYTFKNEPFYFDLEDFGLIKDYCWCIIEDEYVVTNDIDSYKKLIWMHRLVMNCPDDMEVDHEFHNNWDNRKKYLRIVTRSQNCINRGLKSVNTSGITGVSWHNKNEKWVAYIQINGKQTYLGSFDDFNEAVQMRKEAELEYFGEYRYKDNQSLSEKEF
jgi:hypothetical protein